jgi:predicted GH43/DUF377 family glycosyl hydrolase
LNPDVRKVIPRFFNTGNERSLTLINRVLQMPNIEANNVLLQVYNEFSNRYKDIGAIFDKHFELIKHLLPHEKFNTVSKEKKLLIGSYFTLEYSLEHAALFNPSVVEDPDQFGAAAGEKNVIISFRATGEGHISSLLFKRGKLDKDAMIHFEPSGRYMIEGQVTQQNRKLKFDTLSMVNISYDLHFSADTLLSERVIFPVTFTEKNGIEDARFVKFTGEDGSTTYIATYTAYDGSSISPHLIETTDFLHFKMSPLHGKAAINKNLAIFPRKVNGQYAMLSRIDGINNYIMFSDDLYWWDSATLLQEPVYPWEFVQIGNGGSPIETERGWLLITHGVGPMRKYCLGASLLDLNDPSRELGRLKEPLLMPEEDERYGYVPNVVYSCGAIIHNNKLFIPYAVSDYATSFITIVLNELLDKIMPEK